VPSIFSDDKKLSQILRNFISNALKFTPEGEVRVRAVMDGPGAVIFSVSDTGIGIAPEHLEGLFRDFAQVDSRLHSTVRGTGLGLSLSKKLASILGGSVSATSAVGVGSTFSVRIPTELRQETPPDGARPDREASHD